MQREGHQMGAAGNMKAARLVPKKRPKHHSYDESVDEPATLLEQEAVEIEKETPSEDTRAIERGAPDERGAPAFEE
jgi:hypothetical protein